MTPDEELQRFHDHCQTEIVKTLVATIGECLNADPYATSMLLLHRSVECNLALALHPFVPVSVIGGRDNPGYLLGVLGLLNAIVAKLTDCYIVTTAELADGPDGHQYEKIVTIELKSRKDLVAAGVLPS